MFMDNTAPCPLLAIALVIGSSRGRQIVAHYPPKPSPVSSTDTANTKTPSPNTTTSSIFHVPQAKASLTSHLLYTPLAALATDHVPRTLIDNIRDTNVSSGKSKPNSFPLASTSSDPTVSPLHPFSASFSAVANAAVTTQTSITTSTSASIDQNNYNQSTADIANANVSANSTHSKLNTCTSPCSQSTLLGFQLSLLADLLAPKPSCCDIPFELSIDDLYFLGLPISLSSAKLAPMYGRYPGLAPYYRHRIEQYLPLDVISGDSSDADSLDMTVDENLHEHSMTDESVPSQVRKENTDPELCLIQPGSPSLTFTSATPSKQLPHRQMSDGMKTHQETNPASIYHSPRSTHVSLALLNARPLPPTPQLDASPSLIPVEPILPQQDSATPTNLQLQSVRLHINMFHLVFISTDLSPKLQDWIRSLYNHVVVPLTWALKHEQIRHEYVAREAAWAIQDSRKRLSSSTMSNYNDPITNTGAHQGEILAILKNVFDAIVHACPAHILINNHLHLSLQVPKFRIPRIHSVLVSDSLAPDNGSAYPFDLSSICQWDLAQPPEIPMDIQCLSWDCIEPDPISFVGYDSLPSKYFPLIRSYHSLAFIHPRDVILAKLPSDASPLVFQLIQWFKPTTSFVEAHISLQVPLYQILRVAAHLIFWDMAVLVHPVSLRSILMIDPNCDLNQFCDQHSTLATEFSTQFPGLDLTEFVSLVTSSPPQVLSTYIPDPTLRPVYLDAVGYLLARRVLIHLHTYVYLKIPAILIHSPTPIVSLLRDPQLYHQMQKCFLPATLSWSNLPPVVREWVRYIASSHTNGNLTALFERVAPYFSGRFHTEEIMYRTATTRRDLKSVLTVYSGELVTVLHE